MKKILMTALIASMLMLPLGSTALADSERDPAPSPFQDYIPGSVPAEISPASSMSPAIHGVLLAMLNHDVSSFQLEDPQLTWECLYNMLSLYGQLDSRSETEEEFLLFPSETAQDYAAALDVFLAELPSLPDELTDRLTYDSASGLYRAVCGNDSLSQLQVRQVQPTAGGLQLTGALVYLPDNTDLVQFQATLQPRDNMFGYAITAMTLN